MIFSKHDLAAFPCHAIIRFALICLTCFIWIVNVPVSIINGITIATDPVSLLIAVAIRPTYWRRQTLIRLGQSSSALLIKRIWRKGDWRHGFHEFVIVAFFQILVITVPENAKGRYWRTLKAEIGCRDAKS